MAALGSVGACRCCGSRGVAGTVDAAVRRCLRVHARARTAGAARVDARRCAARPAEQGDRRRCCRDRVLLLRLRGSTASPARRALRRVAPLRAGDGRCGRSSIRVLGGQLWHAAATPIRDAAVAPASASARPARRCRVLNLRSRLPDPGRGWAARGAGGAAARSRGLAGAGGVARRRRRRAVRGNDAGRPHARWRSGVAWALIGWLPLLAPSLGWHAYYALLGALGAWLALGDACSRRCAGARRRRSCGARAATAPRARSRRRWTGAREWYQRRAGGFLDVMRGDLLRTASAVRRSTRDCSSSRVPSNVGFHDRAAPGAARCGTATRRCAADCSRGYTTRRRAPPGPDLFFRLRQHRRLDEVEARRRGRRRCASRAIRAGGRTRQTLAAMFARAGRLAARRRTARASSLRAEPDVARAHAWTPAWRRRWRETSLAATSWLEGGRVAAGVGLCAPRRGGSCRAAAVAAP